MIYIKVAKRVDLKSSHQDFPGGPVFKNPPANPEDTGSISDQEHFTCHEETKPMHRNC